ncbi:MAG TPA: acetyl-CoA synthetase [Clostridiales bacterium]|nr:acetyl-CoA synthetase [Clostridiales bacterium]
MLNLHRQYLREEFDKQGNITNFEFQVPDSFNFAYDVVDLLGREEPGRRAMFWCNEAGEKTEFTFADFSQKSDQCAAWFQSLGIRKGDRVMLILKRHYQFWFTILALHKIGAVAIPATNQLLTKDLLYRLRAADISTVVCTPDGDVSNYVEQAIGEYGQPVRKIMVRQAKPGWLLMEDGMAQSGPFVRPDGADAPANSDMMLLYFTSGTTGMPKMVCHDFTYPIGHLPTAKYWHKVDPDGLHLTVAETGWAKSVWGKLYGQWMMEAGIYVFDYDRFSASVLLRKIQDDHITTFCAPPTIYRFLIKEDLTRYDLSGLQHCTIAGEALNPEVYERFLRATGLQLKEGYGQTEMTLAVVTNYWMATKPGSMGRPSPAYKVVLLDENGKPVPPGQSGEICIRVGEQKIPGMFTGYHKDPALTGQVWHDGYYHTGDLAWQDEEGYFWFVGRFDDIIKSSGYRIGPFEVESVLMEHPAVLECAITGEPDPVRGQLVKATVVLARGYEPTEELKAELQNYVKTHTAPYKYPRILVFVPELPKTISGKIRRVEIRQSGRQNGSGDSGGNGNGKSGCIDNSDADGRPMAGQ